MAPHIKFRAILEYYPLIVIGLLLFVVQLHYGQSGGGVEEVRAAVKEALAEQAKKMALQDMASRIRRADETQAA
eukprot:2004625-Pyramimonas_sp.AAC.1